MTDEKRIRERAPAVPGMNLQTYVAQRLARWAVWCLWRENLLTRSPKPMPLRSWWGGMMRDRVHDSDESLRSALKPCPVDVLEAAETDLCVQALVAIDEKRGVKYAHVIVLCYLSRMSKHERAAAMVPPGCVQTYYNRLSRAHDELLGLMNDAGAGLPLPIPSRRHAAAA